MGRPIRLRLLPALGALLLHGLNWAHWGTPAPEVHDEFSYLLAAGTFAEGRLSMPPHAHPEFFETMHVLTEPTYASKYPPGQALFLAAGQALFGHPWHGVALSSAFLAAAAAWMLTGWVAPRWALAGAFYLALWVGFGHYWSQSYWGGCVAAAGAALVLGSLGRSLAARRASHPAAFAGGAALLWLTRPFEGGVLVAAVFLVLLALRLPIARRWWMTIAGGAMAMLVVQIIYNHAVTGDATRLPYLEHQSQYNSTPALWILPPLEPRREVLADSVRRHHGEWEFGFHRYWLQFSLPERLFRRAQSVAEILRREWGWLGLLLIGAAAFALRDARARVLLALAVLAGSALLIETWMSLHYLAPVLMVLLCLFLVALDRLHGRWKWLAIALFAIWAGRELRWDVHRWRDWRPGEGRLAGRSTVEKELARRGGRHLVFVRYNNDHDTHCEWVYNGPRIDGQAVVWAHDLGPAHNQKLIDYYGGRRSIWRVNGDQQPVRLEGIE